jgi:hypothetical protein
MSNSNLTTLGRKAGAEAMLRELQASATVTLIGANAVEVANVLASAGDPEASAAYTQAYLESAAQTRETVAAILEATLGRLFYANDTVNVGQQASVDKVMLMSDADANAFGKALSQLRPVYGTTMVQGTILAVLRGEAARLGLDVRP